MLNSLIRKHLNLLKCTLALILVFGLTNKLISRKAGITGQTHGGCGVSGSCHLTSADAATGISFTSSSGNFNVYTSVSINVTIRVTHATLTKGGINFGVKSAPTAGSDVGTISNPGSGLKQIGSEITHDNPVSYSGGGYDYTFTWTAPSTPGTYYVVVSANSVNANDMSSGDIWNQTTQTIVVTQGPTLVLTSPNGGENVCPGEAKTIQWTSSGFTSAKIELSSDGGSSYPTLIATVPASTGSYSWNVPGNQAFGNQYKIKISDPNYVSTFDESNANFSVSTVTQILTQPQSKSICTGTSSSIWLTASGNSLGYVWKKNGSEISGANSSTYTFPTVSAFDAGSYVCTVTGACGVPLFSNTAVITVNNGPFITVDPKNTSFCIGSTAVVWGDATGDNLNFKWQKDGVDIVNSNSKTLSIPNFQQLNVGTYKFFAISNGCSTTVTSNSAILQKLSAPSIDTQPENTNVCLNSPTSLFVSALGSNLQYQWYQDGNLITNANSSTYSLLKSALVNSGKYYCKVSGSCDPALTSSTITLNVNTAPVIALQPLSKTGVVGGSVTFTVASSSTTTAIQYQWFKGASSLAGKTSQTLDLNNLTLTDAGIYNCKLSNSCGTITSASATLNVNAAGSGVLNLASNLVSFDEVLQGKPEEKPLTNFISNTGKKALKITEINMIGVNKDNFKIKGLTLPVTIDTGKTQSISVEFTPGTRGLNVAGADFKTEDNQVVSLGLIGKSAIANPIITSNKPEFVINSKVGETTSTTITYTNASSSVETISTPIVLSDNNFKVSSPSGTFSIGANKTQDLVVLYTPKADGKVSCTVTLKVDFAINPVLTVITANTGLGSVDYDENLISNISAIPNPIENNSEISFDIPNSQQFEFKIFDIRGKIVKSFVEPNFIIGHYVIKWDGSDNNSLPLNSGTYYGIYQSGNRIKTIILNLKK
jgi:hypothetical protein